MKKVVLFLILLIIFIIWILPEIISHYKAVNASAGFPYQIGLTKVNVTPCFTTGTPPLCEGGLLCFTKDAATCLAYSDVSGVPAGGMGSNALFLNAAITKAGLTTGGQLIAGGMSPVLMDNGVLASAGGCFGCLSETKGINRFVFWFDKYIIAGFKGSKK
ncbi:MAG: hypothetical protein ABIG60_02710 [Patescibacteria group bacterium]